MSEITSRPYQPAMACERCCFGRGPHAEWCAARSEFVARGGGFGEKVSGERWCDIRGRRDDDLPETGGAWSGICRMEPR